MADLCKLIWCAFAGLFRSRAALHVEILVLRHQLNVLHRKSPGRITFSGIDRLMFAGFYGMTPGVLAALQIVKPDTVIRGIASMDLFVVPTVSFRLLYGFLILQHSRRELLWLGVTAHPTAE